MSKKIVIILFILIFSILFVRSISKGSRVENYLDHSYNSIRVAKRTRFTKEQLDQIQAKAYELRTKYLDEFADKSPEEKEKCVENYIIEMRQYIKERYGITVSKTYILQFEKGLRDYLEERND